MQFAMLGSTGLKVSRIGFGCFAIGGHLTGNGYGPTDDDQSFAALRRALDLGCTFFDTADVYGHGRSEGLVGRALAEAGTKGIDAVVATKVGGRFDSGKTEIDFTPSYIERAVDASLRRLRRDRIDLYQLHNPSLAVIERGEVFEAMRNQVRLGKVRAFGISIHHVEEGLASIACGGLGSVQLPFSVVSLVDESAGIAKLMESCSSRDIGVIARQPLAAGFLSGRHTQETSYGPGDIRGQWPLERRRLLMALADAFREHADPDLTLAQNALRFVLAEPVSTVIVGMKTVAQVEENLAWSRIVGDESVASMSAAEP